MKSIQNQYRDLKEGRMSQHNFMRNLRMSMPQYITNITSFNDAVKILKNKAILTEAYADEAPSYNYNGKKLYVDNQSGEPDEVGGKVSLYDEDENEYVGIISSIDGEGMISVDPESIQPAEDVELASLRAKYGDELGPEDYKFQDVPGAISEVFDDDEDETPEDYEDPDMFDAYGMDASEGLSEKSYNVSKDAIPVSSLKKGDILNASGLEIISISTGAKTPSGKIEVTVKDPKTGKELTKVWNKATKVVVKKEKLDEYEHTYRKINGVCYKIDDEGNKTKVADHHCRYSEDLNEAKKKKEDKKELNPNQIHPQELRMGIKVELEHTDDLDKAKKIALDHLAENPFYYTALKLAGVESPSAPKAKAPKAAKKTKLAEPELTDKENAMKPVKGVEKIKASSNKASKETNKIVKGVEELTHTAKTVRGLQKFAATGGKMKTIKEAKLNIMGEPNAVVKQAMEWVDTNLPSISDEIEFQQSNFSPDEAILRYGYWDILPEDAVVKLKSQFNVEADSDEMDDQLPINYYRLKLKKPSFRPGVDLGKSFDKFKSTLEEIVREVVNETFNNKK